MLVNLLSGKSFFIQIILGTLFFILFLGNFYNSELIPESIWGIITYSLTVIVCALFFNSSKLFKTGGIPFWFFTIWMFVFSGLAANTKISVSLLICTILFWRMIHAEEKSDSKNYAFDVGICLSISAFCYPPSIFMIGLVLFNYLYMQSLNLRVILLFILGFILPLAVGVQILYLTDNTVWLSGIWEYFYLNFWDESPVLALIPIVVLIIIAWLDHLSNSGTQDINKRHIYFLFFLYFINWLIILALFGGISIYTLAILGFPVSVFIGRYIQYQNSAVWKEIILWLFLAILAGFYFRVEIADIYTDLLGNVSF